MPFCCAAVCPVGLGKSLAPSMTRGAAKRVGVPVDVSCEEPPSPHPALCVCWELHLCSLFTVQLWLLCSRTRPWGHHRRRIRLHSRPLTPSPHPRIVKWCPARWVCASIPLCLLLLTPTPTLHGLYLALGMMHVCESVCVCVFMFGVGWGCVTLCRATHEQDIMNIHPGIGGSEDTVPVYRRRESLIFEHCAAVMLSVRDWLYLHRSESFQFWDLCCRSLCQHRMI